MSDRYFAITFPENLVQEPALYALITKYGLKPNVIRASVTNTGGWMILHLGGEDEKIDEALLDFKCRGAMVQEGGEEMRKLEAPSEVSSVRVRIGVPKSKVAKPVLNDIVENKDVMINIRQAMIDPKQGVIDLEISGTLESIDESIELLKMDGISVDPIEGNVIE